MTWSKENIEKLKHSWRDRDKREQCFKPAPKCPSCEVSSNTCKISVKGGQKASSHLTKNEDHVVCKCPLCGEELLIIIHIPKPTYSTYVASSLPKEDENE